MSKKIKFSTLFIITIFVIFLIMTYGFVITSINSVRNLGNYAEEIYKQSTKSSTSMFFRETTYRATNEYSSYFSGVSDLASILAKQVSEEISLSHAKNRKALSDYDIIFTKPEGVDFYISKQLKDTLMLFWGEEKCLNDVKSDLSLIAYALPSIAEMYERNKGYFQNIWIHSSENYFLIYPYNEFYNRFNSKKELGDRFDLTFNDADITKPWEDGKNSWTVPYIDLVTGQPIISVIAPVYVNEKVVAIVGIDLNLENLLKVMSSSKLLERLEGVDENKVDANFQALKGFIFIIDDKGNIISFPYENYDLFFLKENKYEIHDYFNSKEVNLGQSSNEDVKELVNQMLKEKRGINVINLKGDYYIVSFNKISSVNWLMGFVADTRILMESVVNTKEKLVNTENQMIKHFILITIVLLFISIIIVLTFFRKFFVNPIDSIRKEIKKMGDGNFNLQLKDSGTQEMSELAAAFNLLACELNNYIENLKVESAARQEAETEIKVAAQMQQTILPGRTSEFETGNFILYADLKPAKEVSGDFYDYFFIDENRVAFLIADVSGKGLQAAFFMAMSKVLIKNIALKYKDNPANILSIVNKALCMDNNARMFVTVFLGFYDINSGELVYANGGHHNCTLLKNSGEVADFGILGDVALGFYEDAEYKNEKLMLEKGDIVTMYTDGVIESISPTGEEYGEKRLNLLLEQNSRLSIEGLCRKIFKDVETFENGHQFDDITIVMLKKLQ